MSFSSTPDGRRRDGAWRRSVNRRLVQRRRVADSGGGPHIPTGRSRLAESVYRVTEVIGVSSESWEAAARAAVETAAKTVRDLRIAEVIRQDLTIGDGGVVNYRVRLGISFKYDSGD